MSKVIRYAPAIVRPRPRRWLEGLRSFWRGPISLKDPALTALFGEGASTAAGIAVSPETAFTFSAVYDAVNQGSSDVAKLPLILRKRRADGGSDPYVESKVYRLMKVEPNPEMGSMVFRRTLQAHAMTWHGGFAEIERDSLGRPAAIWPLSPDRVTVERIKTQLAYRVRNDRGDETILEPRDVLHIHGIGFDPHVGYSTVHLARQAIGLALAAERFGASFFGNGSTFGGILSTDQLLSKEQQEMLRTSLESIHKGPDRAHRLAVLWGGLKYARTGIPPNEAQMNELRSKQVEEVARFFNFPVHKLKNLDRATNNNIEQQDLEYYKGFILDWITLWEQELDRKLIPALEARQQYFKHNANAFLRGDTAARAEFYGALIDRGVINADDVRDWEDLNPQSDGQGKMYLVQGAMLPKDKLLALTDAKIAKETAPPAPPQPGPPAGDMPDGDEMVTEMKQRAIAADAAADAARQDALAHAAARAAAEATATTTTEELAQYRAREAAATALAATLTAHATDLAAELETVRQQIVIETAARVTAEATAAREVATAAETLAAVAAERDAAQQAAEAAAARADEADAAAADARRQAAEHAARVDAAERLAVEATSARVAAETAAATALEETAASRQAVSAAKAAEAEALAQWEALRAGLADLTAARAAAEEAAQAADAARLAAVAEAESLREDVARQRATAASLETRMAETDAARLAAEQAATAIRAAEEAAAAGILSAHRALAAHTMRLMVERETDRARRAQASPEKLRAWMATWYDQHQALMISALQPVVQVHLAYIRSTEAPADVTAALVSAHIADSRRQLAAIVEGDAGALAGSLAQLLSRWESERPAAFADGLFAKELEYVRRRAA